MNQILIEHAGGERLRPLTIEERRRQLEALQMPAEWVEKKLADEEKASVLLAKHMAPPGGIPGLPPMLERKRLAYGITDHYFRHQALFDRVFLFQIHDGDGRTYGSGIIDMPEDQQQWEKEQAPQGILISAGLTALDNLRSNGVDLGHTVIMNKVSPYHFRVGHIGGRQLWSLIARDGDLCGSLESMSALRDRQCAIVTQTRNEDGLESFQHVLKDREGKLWAPGKPWISDDQ